MPAPVLNQRKQTMFEAESIPDQICSAKRCRNDASWALLWNNPKIHTSARRKVWLACDEHREHLSTFLSARSFLQDVIPISELDPTLR